MRADRWDGRKALGIAQKAAVTAPKGTPVAREEKSAGAASHASRIEAHGMARASGNALIRAWEGQAAAPHQ